MARQGGRVQLEQSDMQLALNTAKMAKGGFLHAAIEQTQFLIKKPWAKVQEEKKRGVEFPARGKVNAAMERHPAMLRENHTDGCLFCHNGTAQNPKTCWRYKGTGPPSPKPLRPPTPELTPYPLRMPPVPPGYNEAAHITQIQGVPPGSVYIHTPLPSAQLFNPDGYAQDHKCDNDFNSDLLTDDGTSTGLYTISCMGMRLTSILQTTAAY